VPPTQVKKIHPRTGHEGSDREYRYSVL
jgi:hypothetical protein